MKFTEYLKLTKSEQIKYKISSFLVRFFKAFIKFFVGIGKSIWGFIKGIGIAFKNLGIAFAKGDIWTKLSFFILGIGHIRRKQFVKGILFFIVEVVFIIFIVTFGLSAIRGFITLGESSRYWICNNNYAQIFKVEDEAYEVCMFPSSIAGDNSARLLLFGIMTICFTAVFIAIYTKIVNNAYRIQCLKEEGRKLDSFLDDLKSLLNKNFHFTLLCLPITGILIFTIFPILDMMFMAFTNYDAGHQPPQALFDWVGFDNFARIFMGGDSFGHTFVEILKWTLLWAVLATFLNYFLGMFVALLINKKTVKFKKFWRTILVFSIAMPQFVSLLALSKFLGDNGQVNITLLQMGILQRGENIRFLSTTMNARISIIIINIWIGIPYTVLSTTGILMNIPEDLYESARIDGASPFKIYRKITFPYILFVTTPYLITTFINNVNNFGVIYYLTQGGPQNDMSLYGNAGGTDLLVTWLYKMTMEKSDYSLSAVVGIFTFLICAGISLVIYRNSSSFKNEEDFQ